MVEEACGRCRVVVVPGRSTVGGGCQCSSHARVHWVTLCVSCTDTDHRGHCTLAPLQPCTWVVVVPGCSAVPSVVGVSAAHTQGYTDLPCVWAALTPTTEGTAPWHHYNPALAIRLFWLQPTFLCCFCTGCLEQYRPTCNHLWFWHFGHFQKHSERHLFNSAYTSSHWQPSIGASDSLFRDLWCQPKKYLWLSDWLTCIRKLAKASSLWHDIKHKKLLIRKTKQKPMSWTNIHALKAHLFDWGGGNLQICFRFRVFVTYKFFQVSYLPNCCSYYIKLIMCLCVQLCVCVCVRVIFAVLTYRK